MHNVIGIEFQYFLPRYASLPNDTILNDVNGKPVLKPGGVINTEVHDGTAYMDTSAIDNLAVPTEEIVLFSATKNSFNEEGFSQTFLGDKIWYNINLTAIYDDNGNQIGTRKGLITRRASSSGYIDIPKDWRVVKYRRWLIDEPSRLRLLNQDQDILTSKTAYQSKFLYSSTRRVYTSPTTFYVGLSLEGGLNSVNSNGIRYNSNYTVLSSISAKDRNIFELDANYNPVDISLFKIKNLDNCVFNSVSAELNSNLYIDSEDSSLYSSTFASYGSITMAGSNMTNIMCQDTYNINLTDTTFSVTTSLGYTTLEANNSYITRCVFGVIKGGLSGNSNPQPAVAWLQLTINSSTLLDVTYGSSTSYNYISDSRIVFSSIYVHYSPSFGSGDSINGREIFRISTSVLSQVVLQIGRNVDKVLIKDVLFYNSNSLRTGGYYRYLVTSGGTLFSQIVKLNQVTKKLYYESRDASDVLTVNQFAVLENLVPGTPTIGTAVTGNTQATVSYTAPSLDNGSVITSYVATSSPGGLTGTLVQAGSGVITVTGLTNGVAYTFTVRAINSIGTSLTSNASNVVTPI
jgi:hypothetical protein